MSILEALILGVVQGITEFLPISSTAHIVIASLLLNLRFPGLVMEIFLHLASVLAVIIYFRHDLAQIIKGFFAYIRYRNPHDKVSFIFSLYIILATIITGVLGVVLTDFIDESLKTPPVIAFSLVVTGSLLIFIERFHRFGDKNEATMGLKDTFIVALGQTLAVIPGISRSGSTLVAALWTGLNRETAVRFSFLLAIPVILGSTVLMVKDLEPGLVAEIGLFPLFIAFVASFIFSIIGIIWLIDFLEKSRLIYFAVYCYVLAAFVYFFLDRSLIIDL
ncbi:undecaprenyl-diphosphatase [Caldalkalibacillus thermarum TA2.A1]|uniref:Undecaprenyl-diphosphatase n=1 Tax=Caldalkalibacillus thermarum (strain TA2.A1) TaxID=986075 RepID=A0A8X8LAI1_CALTT|nr:undecaprenyl-diphosphate phosphatase [Caldalkalibacillus thermarum]QZT32920.1 undecaprenyl-diphosphatase [Caldalkalibacillus thermarum TA2.A1]